MTAALHRDDAFRFDKLRAVLPNLTSLNVFWQNPSYIGGIQVTIETREADPSPDQWLRAAYVALHHVANDIKHMALEHFGTHEFEAKPIQSVITNRTVYVAATWCA
jgi:hypothetical protein